MTVVNKAEIQGRHDKMFPTAEAQNNKLLGAPEHEVSEGAQGIYKYLRDYGIQSDTYTKKIAFASSWHRDVMPYIGSINHADPAEHSNLVNRLGAVAETIVSEVDKEFCRDTFRPDPVIKGLTSQMFLQYRTSFYEDHPKGSIPIDMTELDRKWTPVPYDCIPAQSIGPESYRRSLGLLDDRYITCTKVATDPESTGRPSRMVEHRLIGNGDIPTHGEMAANTRCVATALNTTGVSWSKWPEYLSMTPDEPSKAPRRSTRLHEDRPEGYVPIASFLIYLVPLILLIYLI